MKSKVCIAILALSGTSIVACDFSPSEIIGQKVAEAVAEKAIEGAAARDGQKADVDISNGTMTVKTDKGQIAVNTGAAAGLPADFPKDVQLPDGATILLSSTVPEGHSLTLESTTPPADILMKFSASMTAQGWKQTASMDMGGAKMANFEKDTRTANLIIGQNNGTGKSTCQLTIVKKPTP